MTSAQQKRFEEPVLNHIHSEFGLLRQEWTVQETIAHLRTLNVGEKIVYFYVVGENDRLVGVVPTRKLLLSAADQKLSEVMNRRVVAMPKTATVFDACEFFVLHKFFALPVVDEERRVLGVVDISLVTDEVLEGSEPQEQEQDVFEVLGFHLSQARNAAPLQALRFRFPWLVATILSGTVCALITGLFEETLKELLVLTFFLPLVFGLGESVSMQSMAISIQALRVNRPTLKWYFAALRREAATAMLLGLACGAVVLAIVWAWRSTPGAGVAIGTSVLLSFLAACILGLSVPSLLHALKLDPKIAAGPVTLALTDIATLLFYFGVAAIALR
ncbi:MAG: magnesium transporter [Verrucomicrobia bacterium]|nr:magnesium transporter [Verrucomicrobiota bacterium]